MGSRLNTYTQSPSIILGLIAAVFLIYMASSYSNNKSANYAPFENYAPAAPGAPLQQQQPAASPKSSFNVAELLPKNHVKTTNLLNPNQIIGMKGQVKRNQTYDLRGGIPIPKTNIPFNNSVYLEEDIRSAGMHGNFS